MSGKARLVLWISITVVLTLSATIAILYIRGWAPAVLAVSSFTSVPDSVAIQPFNDADPAEIKALSEAVREVLPNTVVREPVPLPEFAFYKPRNRYRADSLLHFLSDVGDGYYTVIGITTKDISATKSFAKDWGVMGLGERPGDACVVSTFRLSKASRKSQLYKVCLHELGHTAGLPHCPEKMCFMRNAEGGNPTDEETGFCAGCAAFLKKRGWKLAK